MCSTDARNASLQTSLVEFHRILMTLWHLDDVRFFRKMIFFLACSFRCAKVTSNCSVKSMQNSIRFGCLSIFHKTEVVARFCSCAWCTPLEINVLAGGKPVS
uniref:Uncharacterized protein n=1 Tax=Anopheles minimus TaxID=112268 RepID=A0A182WP83_9DIPT